MPGSGPGGGALRGPFGALPGPLGPKMGPGPPLGPPSGALPYSPFGMAVLLASARWPPPDGLRANYACYRTELKYAFSGCGWVAPGAFGHAPPALGGPWGPIFPPFWGPGAQNGPRAPLGPLGPYWALCGLR